MGPGKASAAGALPGRLPQPRAGGDPAPKPPGDEIFVQWLIDLPGEQARTNLRAAAPGAARHPLAGRVVDINHIAVADIALHARDRPGEDPGMTLPNWSFFAWVEREYCHSYQ